MADNERFAVLFVVGTYKRAFVEITNEIDVDAPVARTKRTNNEL
jgi:hypothetical protein